MIDYSKKNINQIVVLGSSGYLGLSFIKYYFNQFESNKNISLILFSSNYSKILEFFKLKETKIASKSLAKSKSWLVMGPKSCFIILILI